MAFLSSNIQRYGMPGTPSLSSRRMPNCTRSTLRRASQRLSRSAGAALSLAMAFKSFWKDSITPATAKFAFFAAAMAGDNLSTAATICSASPFLRAISRISARSPESASTALIQASFGPSGSAVRPSTPNTHMMFEMSSAAFNTGASEASGRASRRTLHSEMSFDVASTTLGVLKLSRIAAWIASLVEATDASSFASLSPGCWPFGCRLQNPRLPRKCFILRSSALAMSMAWSE
mmetsp:Transcript_81846/g.265118  ORF Transcript_81846/g.265118 Transcript_81846/m.265118 type:complete len:234 (-) Transcript_81846:1706-2407(-)